MNEKPSMHELLQEIDDLKKAFDAHQPLPVHLKKNMYEWMRVALTYNSNALEGNTLSLQETAYVLHEQRTVPDKSLIEHLEVVNHAKAFDLVMQLAEENKKPSLTVPLILKIHQTVLQSIDDTHAGIFRTCAIRIVGSQVPRPNYLKVAQLMESFFARTNDAQEEYAIICAADALLEFVFIHPFIHGNGRTARLLLNLLLLQEGYPPIIIEVKNRFGYLTSIERALKVYR